MNMKEAIDIVVKGNNLSIEEAMDVMNLIMEGISTPVQTASFLTALRMKSETLDEMIGCAKVLQQKASHISPKSGNYIDLVGTGGDGANTFNISTTTVFVVAAGGVPVAKHGNRSVSSKSGSADVLEELGVNIMLEPEMVQKCVDEIGIGFMFAQKFIPKMKNVSPVRKEMGIRTIFNILGPLSNPSGAKAQVIGVFNPKLTEPYAQAMRALGVERAVVMHGMDGMDEFTVSSDTVVSEIKDGRVINYKVTPEQFGFERCLKEQLTGGDKILNAKITKDILTGTKGAKRDIVLLNSAYGLYAGGAVKTIEDGIELAKEMIDSGKAMQKLEQLIEFTNKAE